MTDRPITVPSYQDLMVRKDAPPGSSWGLFPNDQIGTLNFLTPDRVVAAAGLIREGKVFNLDYPLNAFLPNPTPARQAAQHHIFQSNSNHRDDWVDSLYMQSTSQIDGLRHMRHPEHGFYGGVRDDHIGVGLPDLGMQLVADHGIVGRGVLVDIERYLAESGNPLDLTSNYMVTPEDLEAAAKTQGLEFRFGDIMLLHTGWSRYFLEKSDDDRLSALKNLRSPGLQQSEAMLEWLWDHQIALIASDNGGVEAFPVSPDSGFVDPDEPLPEKGINHNGMMHRPLIALLGFFLGELWRLDELAKDCAEDHVYEFFLSAKPLNLLGGVGSPPNAVAIK